MSEFKPWPKSARWFRNIIITEKIDGTNAAVLIEEHPWMTHLGENPEGSLAVLNGPATEGSTGLCVPEFEYVVYAQSRTQLITPTADNHGFAKWAQANAATLVRDLGPGRHFGEWWGQGIQRKYGMDRKVFSLFNTVKWSGKVSEFQTPNMTTVPVLYEGPNDYEQIDGVLDGLEYFGSKATDQLGVTFAEPEGICIFHLSSRHVYKVTLENDEVPKSTL